MRALDPYRMVVGVRLSQVVAILLLLGVRLLQVVAIL